MESPVPPACKQNSACPQDGFTHRFLGACIAVHTIDTCNRYVLDGEKYFISCINLCS